MKRSFYSRTAAGLSVLAVLQSSLPAPAINIGDISRRALIVGGGVCGDGHSRVLSTISLTR